MNSERDSLEYCYNMRSQLMLGLSSMLLLCAAVNSQSTYDGRNGPHVFGQPGEQVYIRGQNEGPYNVNGVPGTFQNSPSRGEHVYTDESGNTYVNRKGGAGGQGTHTISGPNFVASRGPPQQPNGDRPAQPYPRVRRDYHVARPDRTVDYSNGGFVIQRQRRNPQPAFVARPDRTVATSNGDFFIQRQRRSPQSGYVSRPDGRSVSYGPGGVLAHGYDGRTVAQTLIRRRRARVQGENFVARDDQAGVWNDNVSVWKRPDGRTVTVDKDGNVITSGSPNGRGPQRYSG